MALAVKRMPKEEVRGKNKHLFFHLVAMETATPVLSPNQRRKLWPPADYFNRTVTILTYNEML